MKNPITVTEKIQSESTADLTNIHSFLTSVQISDHEISVFTLAMHITFELLQRPNGKTYVKAVTALLANDLTVEQQAIFDKLFRA